MRDGSAATIVQPLDECNKTWAAAWVQEVERSVGGENTYAALCSASGSEQGELSGGSLSGAASQCGALGRKSACVMCKYQGMLSVHFMGHGCFLEAAV